MLLHRMGLVNRVVPKGMARQAAEQLAADLCRFPQLCLNTDRKSAYEQWALDQQSALANETNVCMCLVASDSDVNSLLI